MHDIVAVSGNQLLTAFQKEVLFMARNPLIDLNTGSSRYTSSQVYSMLLSGNMTPVKQAVVSAVLYKKNSPVIVINLDSTSSYLHHGSVQYNFSLHGNGGYDLFSSMSIRDACLYLQNEAYQYGYAHSEVVQIIRYLELIGKLNHHLGLHLPTIRDINDYYYQPNVIGQALAEMLHSSIITQQDYEQLQVALVRGIKGQLLIDNLLASTDFNLNFSEPGFSVENVKCGQVAWLDLSSRHNSHTEKTARNSILYSIEECSKQMTILINVGRASYNLVADFVQNMVSRPNCQLIVVMEDVFAQVPDYDVVRRSFSVNLLGQHTGESCCKMSSCFHEIYRMETHHARSVDHRLFADRFIDILFHTNHADTTTLVPVKCSVMEQERIANLSERAFIMMDNTGATDYFSLYHI